MESSVFCCNHTHIPRYALPDKKTNKCIIEQSKCFRSSFRNREGICQSNTEFYDMLWAVSKTQWKRPSLRRTRHIGCSLMLWTQMQLSPEMCTMTLLSSFGWYHRTEDSHMSKHCQRRSPKTLFLPRPYICFGNPLIWKMTPPPIKLLEVWKSMKSL